MIGKSAVKLFVGVVATAIAGTAMANTTLDGSSTGDIFLNIEDTTNNTSYLYDTGISQGSFTGNTSFSVSLSGDTALTSFLSQTGNFEYSVVSATRSGAGPFATSTIFITGNATSTPVNLTNADTNAAQSTISSFLTAADNVNTTSSSSVVLPTGSDWGQALTEGVVSNQLFSVTLTPYGDEAALNTAMAFYSVVGGTSSTFAHTWDFSTNGDVLSYNAAPVPLPTPVLLLLSGLGLMGAVARRSKLAA